MGHYWARIRERERATAMAESNDSVFVDVEKIYLGGKVFCFSFGFVFFFFPCSIWSCFAFCFDGHHSKFNIFFMKVGFDFIWDSGFVLYFKKKITRPIWIFVFHFFHKWNDKYGLEILLVLLLLLFFLPLAGLFFIFGDLSVSIDLCFYCFYKFICLFTTFMYWWEFCIFNHWLCCTCSWHFLVFSSSLLKMVSFSVLVQGCSFQCFPDLKFCREVVFGSFIFHWNKFLEILLTLSICKRIRLSFFFSFFILFIFLPCCLMILMSMFIACVLVKVCCNSLKKP